jgi:hypothetical protein
MVRIVKHWLVLSPFRFALQATIAIPDTGKSPRTGVPEARGNRFGLQDRQERGFAPSSRCEPRPNRFGLQEIFVSGPGDVEVAGCDSHSWGGLLGTLANNPDVLGANAGDRPLFDHRTSDSSRAIGVTLCGGAGLYRLVSNRLSVVGRSGAREYKTQGNSGISSSSWRATSSIKHVRFISEIQRAFLTQKDIQSTPKTND